MDEKYKKTDGLYNLIHFQAIRNILIEKGIITHDDYKKYLKSQIEKLPLDDETKQILIERTNTEKVN